MKLHLQAAGIPCRGSGTNKPGVSLLTLHAAKGLEFPVVFLPSLEDKTVPHFHAIGEGPDAIEEERRLFYVGLTRAKSRLYLSSSSSRFGKPREESRFLTELGDAGGCLRRIAPQSQAERRTPAVVA
jgi:superfamily I DNA/RNA helicase